METFRIATLADIKKLATLRKIVWDETYRGIYSDDMIDNFDYGLHEHKFTIQIENTETNVYVIEIDGEEIGYFSIGKPMLKDIKNYGLCLNSLYILSKYQQMGIGSRVFSFIRDYCQNNGLYNFYNSCNTNNTKAKNFYTKMGGRMFFEDSGHAEKAEDQSYFEYTL